MSYNLYRAAYGYGFDPYYILILIAGVLCMVASYRVNSVYSKYARVRSMCGMTGAMVADEILRRNGINDVTINHVSGNLTDHFDPRNKTVNLSDATYNSTSVAAIAVAAHECGHVCQHARGYVPIQIRSALAPAASIGSKMGIPIIFLGFILSFHPLVRIGIIVFSLAVFFQLVTLPVEFDASHRALVMLKEYGILAEEEITDGRKVLTAAAMTYVASAASAVLQLLRFIALNNRRRDD